MKKKLLALIIALTCAITCIPALSACDGATAPKDDNTSEINKPEAKENIAGKYAWTSVTVKDENNKDVTFKPNDTFQGITTTEDTFSLTVKADFTLTLSTSAVIEGTPYEQSETAEWSYFGKNYVVLRKENSGAFRNNGLMELEKDILTLNCDMGVYVFKKVESSETPVKLPYDYPANIAKPTVPEGVQLNDISKESEKDKIFEKFNKIAKSSNAKIQCVAQLTDYKNLNNIISSTGYAAVNDYSEYSYFYDYAYGINLNKENYNYDGYLYGNYIYGDYSLIKNGKQYGLISDTKFDYKTLNSEKTTNKFYNSDSTVAVDRDNKGDTHYFSNGDSLLIRLKELRLITTLAGINEMTSYLGAYNLIYNYGDGFGYGYDFFMENSKPEFKLTVKVNEDKIFISYLVTIDYTFKYELTLYGDADAQLTVGQFEEQANLKYSGVPEITAQSIVSKCENEFPHITFDKQEFTNKMQASGKAELSFVGNNSSPEKIMIYSFINGIPTYIRNLKYVLDIDNDYILNSFENGKIVLDKSKVLFKADDGTEITVAQMIRPHLVSIFIDDSDEKVKNEYIYSYKIGEINYN